MSDHGLAHRPPRVAPWLMEPILANRGTYGQVALAAAMINLFSLATSLFSMTVYDRVVPNNATESLIALSIGISMVLTADFALRTLRAYFVDIAGVRIDRVVGERIFAKVIGMRLDEKRQRSTGAFAGMLREFETLREFFTSATLSAIVDVPFILLFIGVIGLVGGWIVLVPLAMIPLVIGVGLLVRPAMDRLSTKMTGEAQNKQGVLVETVGALETVKASRAGPLLSRRWSEAVERHSASGLRQRLVSTISLTTATSAQNLSYIGTVVAGVHMIGTGSLTMGGLIACSILSGRSVAPLAQIAQLLSRLSATRAAYRQLDGLMSSPDEAAQASGPRRSRLIGAIELRDVTYRYAPNGPAALDNISLKIDAGERVALLGRVGSGKSTILRLALALRQPEKGAVLIDGRDIAQHHPDDLRGSIGSVLQEGTLFSGSVRDNIGLDRREIDDEEMIRSATLSGTHDFMATIANGYDLRLADRGDGLSGGQRQSIAIARALAGRPPILLLDEPTSAMDSGTEGALIERLRGAIEDMTLVVVTHRPSLLRLVERVVVIERGRVVADGPRDEIMRRLNAPRQSEARG